jgi:uncharacterized protein (TIGR02145 family)
MNFQRFGIYKKEDTMKIRNLIIFVVCAMYVWAVPFAFSQDVMRIQKTDNTVLKIPTSEIKSITFEKGSFVPSGDNTVTDVEGNVYKTVTIAEQVWMAENLKTTKLRDGTPIQNVTPDESWKSLNTPAYCWYDNNMSNKNKYGALYNWFCVQSNLICPAGWHVPTFAEVEALYKFLGGRPEAGGKLKEAGTISWFPPNTGASNSTGFHALPGGFRMAHGPFAAVGKSALFWTSTPYRGYDSYIYKLDHNTKELGVSSNTANVHGISIRCIKD